MDLFDVAIAKKMSGGGGGNPNRRENISSTVADLFHEWTYDTIGQLSEALSSGNATARVTITVPGETALTAAVEGSGGHGVTARVMNYGPNALFASYIAWNAQNTESSVALSTFKVFQGSDGAYTATDYSAQGSLFAAALEIIWHPLP